MAEEWLTYREIGARLGLHVEAVRSRVRRAGWRTQSGNDGRTRVLISDHVLVEPVSEDGCRLNKTGELEAAPIAQAETEADVAKARKADEARKARKRWARLRMSWRRE